ncbi:MAG: fatty acid desaturase [Parvularculaceae bacterium]|nr:fatty acid desaturase [Parvularculaceae bacterium]
MLAFLVAGSWAGLHVYSVFFFELSWSTAPFAVAMTMALCWLSVGLFIVAHDAIHGSLAPGRPGVNRLVGQVMTTLYAGFSYNRLETNHHRHHDEAGTGGDPDFSVNHPTSFFPWFYEFVRRHFGLRPLLWVHAVTGTYVFLLGADYKNVVLFYGIGSMTSALQLFYFGTFLPHRHGQDAFLDKHRTRSTNFGWLGSLLSCYHFGYHHEHHLYPYEPWWRLPARRGELPVASP